MSDQRDLKPLDRGLPKWPQMLVRGVPMTVDQAREIIRRTDMFFQSRGMSGNDRQYGQRVVRTIGMPTVRDGAEHLDDWEKYDTWLQRWGFVQTEYVHNTWIASCFVGGPYGWCHPDGTIGYDDNVGKWPSSEAVMDDWLILAREFPWVDATVILMDRESCEKGMQPVCGFRVSEGGVAVFDPLVEGPEREFNPPPDRDFEAMFSDSNFEHGIEWSWIEHWATVNKEIEKRWRRISDSAT